jgi:hypothetical protein
MATASMNGVLYNLRFADGAEPKDFLVDLSRKIHDGATHQGPTRTGQLSRISGSPRRSTRSSMEM